MTTNKLILQVDDNYESIRAEDLFEEKTVDWDNINIEPVESVNKEVWKQTTKELTIAEAYHMKFEKKRYAIANIIPEGLSVIAGVPKIGKTELMVNAAVQVAVGEKIFNYIKSDRKFKVLYYFLEGHLRDAVYKVRCLHKYCKDLNNITFRTGDNGVLNSMYNGGLTDIEKWMEENKNDPKWVIIDTLEAFQPNKKKSNNLYDLQYDYMRDLQKIAYVYDSSITVVHHLNKDDPRGRKVDPTNRIMGSSGITAPADSILILGRNRNLSEGYLQVMGRNGVRERCYLMESCIIESEAETVDGDIENIMAVKWYIIGETTDDVLEAPQKKRTKKEILYDLIKTSPNGLTASEIIDKASVSNIKDTTVRTMLSTMVNKDKTIDLNSGLYSIRV